MSTDMMQIVKDTKVLLVTLIALQQAFFWTKVLIEQSIDYDTLSLLLEKKLSSSTIAPLSSIIDSLLSVISPPVIGVLLVFLLSSILLSISLVIFVAWSIRTFGLNKIEAILVSIIFMCIPIIFRTATLADDNMFALPLIVAAFWEETGKKRTVVTALYLTLALLFHIQSLLVVGILVITRFIHHGWKKTLKEIPVMVIVPLAAFLFVIFVTNGIVPLQAVAYFDTQRWSFLARAPISIADLVSQGTLFLQSISKASIPPYSIILGSMQGYFLIASGAIIVIYLLVAPKLHLKSQRSLCILFYLTIIAQLLFSFLYEPEGLERWTSISVIIPIVVLWLTYDLAALIGLMIKTASKRSISVRSGYIDGKRTLLVIQLIAILVMALYPFTWSLQSYPPTPFDVFEAENTVESISNQSAILLSYEGDGDPRTLQIYSANKNITTIWIRDIEWIENVSYSMIIVRNHVTYSTAHSNLENLTLNLLFLINNSLKNGCDVLALSQARTLMSNFIPTPQIVQVPQSPFYRVIKVDYPPQYPC